MSLPRGTLTHFILGQAIMAPHTYIAGVYLQQGKQNPWLFTEKSVALQLPYTPLTTS